MLDAHVTTSDRINARVAALHALRPPRDVSALPDPSDAVKALLRSGNRIAAIRAYRRQSGASLLEAKRVIARHAA